MAAILAQAVDLAVTILLSGAIAIVILLLIGVQLQKGRVWKLLFYFCTLIISASTIFATVVISHLGPAVEPYNSSYTKFHRAAPLGASVNILTTEDPGENTLLNIHARTGELTNQYTMHPNDDSSNLFQQDNDTLYSVNSGKDANITAIDARHNAVRWQHKLTPATLGTPKTFDNAFTAKPVIDGNYVYLSISMADSDYLKGENDICLFQTNDGTLVSCHRLNTVTVLQAPSDLAVKGGTIFIDVLDYPAYTYQVEALSSKDFSLLWSHPFSAIAISPTILGVQDFCYVYDPAHNATLALRLTDGTVAWSINGGYSVQAVTAAHFYQYEEDERGHVHFAAYNLQMGSKDWSVVIATAPNKYSYIAPVESNKLVYVYIARREINSYNIENGEMHSHTVLHLITAPPSKCVVGDNGMNVINNVLFVVTFSRGPSYHYFNFNPSPECYKEFITALNPSNGFQYWEYVSDLPMYQDPPVDQPLWIVK